MNRTFSDGARRLWSGSYQPFTNTFLAVSVLLFLCDFARLPISNWLDCSVPGDWVQPWRLVAYPFTTRGSYLFGSQYPILVLIFNCFLFWVVGGSLERSWGTKALVLFYAAISIVTALAFTGAALVLGSMPGLGGLVVPGSVVLAALTVGWCCLNPDESVNLYGLIPIRMRYLAAGVCVITFFIFGDGMPFLGVMSIVSCGFAVLWVKYGWAYAVSSGTSSVRLPRASQVRAPKLRLIEAKSPRPRDDRFTMRDLNPLEWLARRRRRKQFEKLINDD